jgi:tetratricopeptide (TPR) repeat protein
MPLDTWGLVYFWAGKLDDAIVKYTETSKYNPIWGQQNIAYIYGLKENYSESIKWIDTFIEVSPSKKKKGLGYFKKGFYNYWSGKYILCLSNLDKAAEFAEATGDRMLEGDIDLMSAWVYYDIGNLEQATEFYKHWFNTYTMICKGQYGEVFPYQILDITAQHNFFTGLIDLNKGRIDSAKTMLKEIKSKLPGIFFGWYKDLIGFWFHLLQAEILLAEGSKNIDVIVGKGLTAIHSPEWHFIWNNRHQMYNFPNMQDVIARFYAHIGELDKAIKEYESLTSLKPQSQDRRLIHPRYYYRLGKLYQKKGLKEKAIQSFNKFIKLWKDCDPIFQPLIKDARKRVREMDKKK